MATVGLMPGSSGKFFEDLALGLDEKRKVTFSNLTGSVLITASAQFYLEDLLGEAKDQKASGLFSSKAKSVKATSKSDLYTLPGDAEMFAETPISDTLHVEVVRNVDVGPKYKSLYIGASP
jgi:hypothetical protein